MEKVWLDKHKYEEAERRFYEGKGMACSQQSNKEPKSGKKGKHVNIEESKCEESKHERKGESQSSIVSEIVRCREHILLSLNGLEAADGQGDVISRLERVENENKDLKNRKPLITKAFKEFVSSVVSELQTTVRKLETRVASLESNNRNEKLAAKPSGKVQNGEPKSQAKKADDDDDELDLFGSDEDEAANKLHEQRVKAYTEKKSKKAAIIAKSSVLLDVKPWDDETNMAEMEKSVRSIEMDGLIWGVSKLVPVAYNVKKLQIVCVVEDDKVSIEELTEKIEEFEDYVQSVDIASFNKI